MPDRCDVPDLLRAAAAAHQPDRERMLARVEAGARPEPGRLAASPRGPAQRPRGLPGWAPVAGAVAALAVTLGAAWLVVGWTAERPSEAVAEAPTGVPGVSGGLDVSGGRAEPGASQRTPEVLPTRAEVDPGSNPYWSQSNVTVTVERPLTAFTLELRIAAGEGVRSTGAWRTLPVEDFTLSIDTEGAELVFRWELREGAQVPPGEHVFAGQYDHDLGPRQAGGDSYQIWGTGADGPVSARGGFG